MLKVTLQKLKNTELIFWLCIGLKKNRHSIELKGLGQIKKKEQQILKKPGLGLLSTQKSHNHKQSYIWVTSLSSCKVPSVGPRIPEVLTCYKSDLTAITAIF